MVFFLVFFLVFLVLLRSLLLGGGGPGLLACTPPLRRRLVARLQRNETGQKLLAAVLIKLDDRILRIGCGDDSEAVLFVENALGHRQFHGTYSIAIDAHAAQKATETQTADSQALKRANTQATRLARAFYLRGMKGGLH